jgi:transcription antitermination factor NusG
LSWYALHVRANAERSVQYRLGLVGIPDFSPTYKAKSRRLGPDHKPLILERYLFPCYVFVDLVSSAAHDTAANMPGVIRLVGYDHPIEIPAAEIHAIRTLAASPVGLAPCSYLAAQAGDLVRVIDGPLAGSEGRVVWLKTQAGVVSRLVLSIEMLHRSVSAEVDADCLQLVKRAKVAA